MNEQLERNEGDPMNLRNLPQLDPHFDGWPEIRQALEAERRPAARWRRNARWIAVAAGILLAVGLVLNIGGPSPTGHVEETQPSLAATDFPQPASDTNEETLRELIAMSQMIETRLRNLRESTAAMPAQSVVYAAELEDMIARVDAALSYNPESLDLWGQRVNLLLDLEFIYQHQWEREYGRIAAL